MTPRVIVQEIIEGDDAAKRVYLSCYAPDGTRTGHAVLRELRCDPVGFGPASVTEPVTDDEVAALCDGWLRRLGYAGICEIEVKRDARAEGVPRDDRFGRAERGNQRRDGVGDGFDVVLGSAVYTGPHTIPFAW